MTKYFTKDELIALQSDTQDSLFLAFSKFITDPHPEEFVSLEQNIKEYQNVMLNSKVEYHKNSSNLTGRLFFIDIP